MCIRNSPKAQKLDGIWDLEWKQNLADRAVATVKQRVSPRQFQIFDAYVIKGWSVKKVMTELGVSMAQVWLRLGPQLVQVFQGALRLGGKRGSILAQAWSRRGFWLGTWFGAGFRPPRAVPGFWQACFMFCQ